MHQPTMNALEFHRIRQELAGFAACKLGKELALKIHPQPSLERARRVQQETTEAKGLLAGGRSLPFGGIQDIRGPVQRAANGGVLTPEQLLMVADTIYGCRVLHQYLTDQASSAPLIARFAIHFGQFDPIEEEVNRCIERGSVSNRASRPLREIRNEMATLEGRIQERLNSLLRQARSHLQESLVTNRNGRYVIPVKASSKNAVPGTVHGASASGATLFVEPESVRHLSDELETWRAMEAAEVEQVLFTLSGLVADQAERLTATLEAVAELDLIVARARLSQAWEANPVVWNEVGEVNLKAARHPLLGREAIGNTIRFSPEERMLIVTGPNTGGKTLLLKTLGLLVLIAQSGLHVPAEAGSTLCFFDQLFADIGDNQSLEQSLSTFSGHIANVAPMLLRAGPGSLVLLDELGSGTDPHEGTGLGIALLEAFLEQGAYTLATTHLREIKEFGRVTAGCAIAGMGFDGESLKPTYRLLYGTLGESHGLEIAARAGLPAPVVARARELLRLPGRETGSAREAGPALSDGGGGRPKLEGASAGGASAGVAGGPPGGPAWGPAGGAVGGSAGGAAAAQSGTGTGSSRWGEDGADLPGQGFEVSLPQPGLVGRGAGGLATRFKEGDEPRGLSVKAGLARDTGRESHVTPDVLQDRANALHLGPREALVLAALSARRCRIWNDAGEREVTLADSLRRQVVGGLLPGDRVLLREGQAVDLRPRVTHVAHRDADTGVETAVAANINHLLILLSARKPDFHASVLARHLFFAEYHGLEPVICLSRADLVPAGLVERWLAPFREVGYRAVALNLLEQGAREEIVSLLGEGLSALIANPGAGKSTLLAGLGTEEGSAGRDRLARREVGDSGAAEVVRLWSGGWLVDLPSLRELGVWKPDLSTGFRSFDPYVGGCAQAGCMHRAEQGCAVREGVERGEVEAARYRRYLQLLKAMGYGN